MSPPKVDALAATSPFILKPAEAQAAADYVRTIRDPWKREYADAYFLYLLGYSAREPSPRPLEKEESKDIKAALDRFFETKTLASEETTKLSVSSQYSTTGEHQPQTKERARILWTREPSEKRIDILKSLSLEHEPYWAQPWDKLPSHYQEVIATYYFTTVNPEEYITISFKGDTIFKLGEIVSQYTFNAENERVTKLNLRPAKGWSKSKGVLKSWGNGGRPPEELEEYEPATIEGEPVPDKYKELIPFIDSPLPPTADFLVAVVPEVGERKIDAVMKQLKDGVETIQDSAQFRLFLTTMSKFHDYSVGNLILIAIQKPGATRVAGFVTWKDLGRWVKAGEKGIAILAPVMPPKPKKEEGEEEEEIPLTPVYFKVVHIFDISQTEGKPLPEFEVPVLTGEANEELFAKVIELAKSQGVQVSFEPRPYLDPSIKGQYSPPNSIWVRPEESRAQQLKSFIHELAHYYSEGVFRIPRRDAETIAESAAFAVGAHYGFDSGVRSFPYVALWSQDKKVLAQNLSSVRKVADTILHALEGTPKSAVKSQLLAGSNITEVRYYWVEKNVPYESWAVIEAWPGGIARSPFNTKEEAIKREEEIWEGVYKLRLVPSPQEKYPKQHEALKKLYPYEFIKYHDDGDLTIQELVPKPGAKLPVPYRELVKGNVIVVTTEGQAFEELEPATIDLLAKTEGDPLRKFCCRQCDECAPKELLEEGKFLDRISWLRHHYKEKHPGMWGKQQKYEPLAVTKGTCYEDAWRFLLKEEEGYLIHGTVWSEGKRIKHAWVETETGYIWEPETKRFYTKQGFENVAAPVEEHRYTPIEASIMAARTKNFGPWTDEERGKYLKRKEPAVIPTEPTPRPRREGDLEFIPDSPEYLAQTIDASGWREQLDQTFLEAIARARRTRDLTEQIVAGSDTFK